MLDAKPPPVETASTPSPIAAPRRVLNPGRAAWLSLLPGLGQLYNGQLRKAPVFFLGVPGLFFASLSIPGITAEFLAWWRPRGSLQVALSVILELLSLLLFIGVFLFGLIFWYAAAHDARASASELNAGQPTTGRWWLFRK